MTSEENNYEDIDSAFSSFVNDKYVLVTNSHTLKAKLTYSKYQKIEMIVLKIIPLSSFLFLGIPYAYSLYTTIPSVLNLINSGEMINHLMLVAFLSEMPLSFKVSLKYY